MSIYDDYRHLANKRKNERIFPVNSETMMDALRKTAAILSQNFGVSVIFRGDRAMTDGNTIIVPSMPENSPEDLIEACIGYIDHEVGHIRHTDFSQMVFAAKTGDKRLPVLLNVIEDVRQEYLMTEEYRGVGLNLERTTVWCLKKLDANFAKLGDWQKLLMLAICRAKKYNDMACATEFLDKNIGMFSPALDLIDHEVRTWITLPSTADALESAKRILALLDQAAQDAQDQLDEDDKNKQEGPKLGKTKPKEPKPDEEKKPKEEKPEEDDGNGTPEEGDSEDEPGEDGGEGEEEAEDDKPGKSKPKKPKKDKKPDEKKEDKKSSSSKGKDDGKKESDDKEDAAGDPAGGDEKEDKGEDKEDGEDKEGGAGKEPGDEEKDEGEDEKDESAGGSGDGEEEPEPPTPSEDGTGKDEGDEDDDADDGDEDGSSGDGDDGEEEGEDENEGDGGGSGKGAGDKPTDDGDGEGTSKDDGDMAEPSPESEPDPELEPEPLTEEEREDLKKLMALTNQLARDIKTNNPKDMSTIQAEMISTNAGVGSGYRVFSTEFDRTIEPNAASGMRLENYTLIADPVRPHVNVVSTVLSRTLLAETRAKTLHGRMTGRISPNGISRIRVGDPTVFKQKRKGRDLNTYVEIVVDQSGSMQGGGKIVLAAKTCIVLSEAIDKIGLSFGICGFTNHSDPDGITAGDRARFEKMVRDSINNRAGFDRLEPIIEICYKESDEPFARVRHRLAAMTSQNMGNNADGDCILRVAKRIMKRKEKRKVMIVLSDGMPHAATGTYDETHHDHMIKVSKMLAKTPGLDVIGIGINTDAVREFYKKCVVVKNIDQLPQIAMSELSKALKL